MNDDQKRNNPLLIYKTIIAALGWFAIIAQFFLLLTNSGLQATEATIRFFSYFTILTNILVAFYFTKDILKPGDHTDFTPPAVYIFVVGAVYQVVLRPLWNPVGLQKIVDELLHSVIPVLVFIYWYFFQKKAPSYSKVKYWFLYPLVYLIFVLIRGKASGFYPYPFLDLNLLPAEKVAINCAGIALFFIVLSLIFVFIIRRKIVRTH